MLSSVSIAATLISDFKIGDANPIAESRVKTAFRKSLLRLSSSALFSKYVRLFSKLSKTDFSFFSLDSISCFCANRAVSSVLFLQPAKNVIVSTIAILYMICVFGNNKINPNYQMLQPHTETAVFVIPEQKLIKPEKVKIVRPSEILRTCNLCKVELPASYFKKWARSCSFCQTTIQPVNA